MPLRCTLLMLLLSFISTPLLAQGSNEQDDVVAAIAKAREQGEIQQAETLTNQLITTAQQQDSSGLLAEAFYQQGRNEMERNQYDAAQESLNKAISIYQDLDQPQKLAHSYRQLGLTYRYQSNYSVALEYVYLSMQIFEQSGNKRDISNGHNSIGVILEKMGQYEEAVVAHQQALEINYELGDQSGIASALYNLGDIRRTMGDDQLALQYFEDALKIDEASGNLKYIAYSHNKIATVQNDLGNRDVAREHVEKALELFRKIQAPRDTDWALTILAQIELDSGNLAAADSHIQGVIERAIENQYNSLLVDAYVTAAKIALAQGDTAKALEYIEAGIKQSRLNDEQAKLAEFEELRVQVHLASDALKEAFEALQRQKQLEDQILNDKRLDSIAKLQAQSEFVRRAHQIELLEKEKSLQQAMLNEQRSNRNFWITISVAGFSVLLLLYGRVIQSRTNQKLEQEVERRTVALKDANEQLNTAYKEMEAISVTDKLTGLRNRRFLEQQIEADLEHTKRVYTDWLTKGGPRPEQQDIVIYIIDFDNFKTVNDNYGHSVGDSVLVQMAKRMSDVFRHTDYLIRWGGEEFVAIARFVNREEATTIAERMLEAVNQHPFDMGDAGTASQTCSIGFAVYPTNVDSEHPIGWSELLSLADACMYAVKTSGKDGWMGVIEAKDASGSEAISLQQLRQMQTAGKLAISGSRDFS